MWAVTWEALERDRTLDKYDTALVLKKQRPLAKDKNSPVYPIYSSFR